MPESKMAVTYPLFALEKGEPSLQLIEDPSRIWTREAADILHGEYIFLPTWN